MCLQLIVVDSHLAVTIKKPVIAAVWIIHRPVETRPNLTVTETASVNRLYLYCLYFCYSVCSNINCSTLRPLDTY